MKNVKCAIIGLGKMGLLHASILNTMPDVEIVAVCEKSPILLKIAKRLFKKSELVSDIDLLNGLNINSAYVTTPISSHFEIIKSLLSRRTADNIFVEKTLASSWEMARDLCELTRKFKGVTMVGYMKRFSVTFRKAKKILSQERLGKISSFSAYAFSSDFSSVQGSKKTKLRGGVLRDLGSHIIDLATWFFGNFEVTSASLDSITNAGSEDAANFVVAVANLGLTGQFRISWCADKYRMPAFGLTVVGDKGTLKVDDYSLNLNLNDGTAVDWFRQDLDDSVDFLLGEPEYYREDEAFVKSILFGRKTENSFEVASRTDYVIDQVKKKAKLNGD